LFEKNKKWKMTSKKNGERPKKRGRRPEKKWKTNKSTKINLFGCDTIVNSPSMNSLSENQDYKSKLTKF
jgi:hypothetical protein